MSTIELKSKPYEIDLTGEEINKVINSLNMEGIYTYRKGEKLLHEAKDHGYACIACDNSKGKAWMAVRASRMAVMRWLKEDRTENPYKLRNLAINPLKSI